MTCSSTEVLPEGAPPLGEDIAAPERWVWSWSRLLVEELADLDLPVSELDLSEDNVLDPEVESSEFRLVVVDLFSTDVRTRQIQRIRLALVFVPFEQSFFVHIC